MRILQTTDPFVYYDLFQITARVNRHFCQARNIDYHAYIGQRVGNQPWHTTFNRIPLLEDAIRDGYRGWLLYMDADAYIANLDFDIEAFLREKSTYSIIAAPGGEQPWCVNAGILFLNLASPFTLSVITKWIAQFERQVGHERLLQAVKPWQDGIKNDQVLLHEVLMKERLENELLTVPLSEVGASTSTFVRQLLREMGTMAERCAHAQRDADAILSRITKAA